MFFIYYYCIVFGILLNVYGSNCFQNWFFDKYVYYQYNYTAIIHAGSQSSSKHVSLLVYKSTLYISYMDSNKLTLSLSKAQHQIYNGPISDNIDSYLEQIQMNNLSHSWQILDDNTFEIEFYPNKTIKGIFTNKNSPIATRMQESIARVWQISPVYSNMFSAFEHDTSGGHNYFYNIKNDSDKYYVHKTPLDYKLPYDDYMKMISVENNDYFTEPLTVNAQDDYIIDKKRNIIESIISTNEFLFYPFKAKSFGQFIKGKQVFTLIKKFEETLPQINKEKHEYHNGLNSKLNWDDITYKKNISAINYEIIKQLLTESVKHFDKSNSDDVLFMKSKRFYSNFQKFTYENWVSIYTELETDLKYVHEFQLLQSLLPFVGTRSSSLLIHNYIAEKKVNQTLALYWLKLVMHNLNDLNMDILKDWNDVFTWKKSQSKNIYKTAMLSYSTLKNKLTPLKSLDRNDDDVTKILQLLQNEEEYSMQVMYVHCLANIRTNKSIKSLEPILRNEVDYMPYLNHHIRLHAIQAASKYYIYHYDLLLNIYWPIFIDSNEHFELRIAAYLALMSSMKMDWNHLWRIHSFLQTEQDSRLYNFHYSTIRSLSKSTLKKDQNLALYCQKIMTFSHEPAQLSVLNSNIIYDYRDPEYGYGGSIKFATAVTQSTAVFSTELSSNFFNIPFNYYSLFFKIQGFDANYIKSADITNFLELNKILKFIMSLSSIKNLKIEYTVSKYNQVIATEFFNHFNLNEFFEQFLKFDLNQELIKTQYEMNVKLNKFFQTHSIIGLPMGLKINIFETLHKQNRYFFNDKKNNYHIDYLIQGNIGGYTSLVFYNPFIEMNQGVKHAYNIKYSLPLYMDLVLNQQQQNMKLSFMRSDKKTGSAAAHDNTKDILGFETYVFDYLYVGNYKYNNETCDKIVKKLNPESKCFLHITKGIQHQKTVNLIDYESENFGSHILAKHYYCERDITDNLFWNNLALIGNQYTKNYNNNAWAYYYLTARNILAHFVLSLGMFNCGTSFQIMPSKQYPVSRIDIFVRLNIDSVPEPYLHLPGYKAKSTVTISIKADQPDKVLKAWNGDFYWVTNPGHEFHYYSVQLKERYMSNPGVRFCINGNGQYAKKSLHEAFNISFGYSKDDLCVTNDGFLINVTKSSTYSKEQDLITSEKYNYNECNKQYQFLGKNYRSMKCVLEHFTFRNYVYDFTINSFTNEYDWYSKLLMYYFLEFYRPKIKSLSPSMKNNDVSHYKYVINYPIWRPHDFDMVIYTPYNVLHLDGMNDDFYSSLGFSKTNTLYSKTFELLHEFGLTQECSVDIYGYVGNRWNHKLPSIAENTWVLLVGEKHNNAIYVYKHNNEYLELKVNTEGNNLEIKRNKTMNYNLILNGNVMTDKYFNNNKLYYEIIHGDFTLIKFINYGLYLVFEPKMLHIEIALMKNEDLLGHCFIG